MKLRGFSPFPVIMCLAFPMGTTVTLAATWYWDANGAVAGVVQASGTWSNGGATWWNGSASAAWNNAADPGNIAHFGSGGETNVGPAVGSRTVTVAGTVNAGGLIFNRSDSTFAYTLTGGTVALADGAAIELVGRAGTDVNRRHRIDSVISGADINITRSTLTSADLAMLRLGGDNTWTGTLTLSSSHVSGLFVEAMNGASLNSLDTVAVGTDSTLVLATADEFTTDFSIAGTGAGDRGAIRFDADGGKISGGVTLAGNATIGTNGTGTTGIVSGIIGESGGPRTLTVSAGSIVLSGANTHTGGTALTGGGILHINNAAALGAGTFTIAGGSINNTSGTAVTLAGNTQTWNGSFTFLGSNDLDLGTGGVTLGEAGGSGRTITVSANTLTVGGVISNGATATGLTKAGAGTLVLSGANTYTGVTAVSGGTLVFTGGSTGGGNVTVANGATLNVRGNYIIGTSTTNVTLSSSTNTSKGTLSLIDDAVNTVNIASLTVGGTGSNSSFLNFDLGDTASDKIVTGAFTANVGGAMLNFSRITGNEIAEGTYSLISFTTSSGTGSLHVGAVPASPAGKVASLTLSSTASETLLNVALANISFTNSAWWTGAESSQWNTVNEGATNFVENANGTGATDILPDASTDVYFTANTSTNLSTTLGQDFSVRSLHFTGAGTPAANAHTIGGPNLLTIGGGGLTVGSGSADHIISSRVALGASQAWNLAGTGTFTVSGAISGAGSDLSLNLNGSRTLTISGVVNHTGSITNSGTGTGATTISGVIGANVTGVIQQSATSQLRLSATNTFTGGLRIKAGSVFGSSSAAAFGAGTIIIGDAPTNLAATLISNLTSTSVVTNPIVLASGVTAALTIASPNTGSQNTFSGGVTGTNNLLLSSTGSGTAGGMRFTTNAVNNTGTVTSVGNGGGTTTIDILGTNVTSVSQAGASPFTIASSLALTATNRTLISTGGGLFSFTGGITGTQDLVLRANSTGGITLSGGEVNPVGSITNSGTGAGTATISAVIGNNVTSVSQAGASPFTVASSLALTATNRTLVSTGGGLFSFTGGITGAQDLVLRANSTGGITLSGGEVNPVGSITNSGTGAGTATISAAIGANVTGVFQNSGTSALTLSGTGANTYTGPTTVSAGVLALNKTDVNAIAGDIFVNGGYLAFNRNHQIADTASVTLTAGGFNTDATGVVNTGRENLQETIGSLSVSGSGVFSLRSVSNFVVAGDASFTGGDGAILFMGSGSAFTADSLTVADMSRISSAAVDNASNSNGFIVYGNHASTRSVVKVGAGGLTLAGDNSTNNIVLRGGTSGSKLSLDGDVTTTGTFASAIIRDAAGGGSGATLVELSATGTGPVTRTFNIGGGGADLTVGANVAITNGTSSSAGLTKTGAGKLTLAGANTYTGLTSVTAGTLNVTGSVASAVTVGTGATLGGTGTVGGATVVQSGGTLSAGNGGIGELTFSGNLTFGTGSIFGWEVGAASYDQVTAASLGGSGGIFSITNLAGSGDSFSDAFWDTDHTWDDIFDIGDDSFDLSLIFTSFGGGNVSSLGVVTGQGGFSFMEGTSLKWTAEAVPEPGNALAGLLIVSGFLSRRRKAPWGGVKSGSCGVPEGK